MEKKIDIRKTLHEVVVQDADPFEMAKRFKSNFFYLLELKIQPKDLRKIERFEYFLRDKVADLVGLKGMIKTQL